MSPARISTEQMTLDALRLEIDHLDEALLDLFERRMTLAARVGKAKGAPEGAFLKLRPDREAAVLAHQVGRARPENRPAVLTLWREIVSAGLARQGEIVVHVWAGAEPGGKLAATQRRFGSSARYVSAETPQAALAAADRGEGVAVLALDAAAPWWIDMTAAHPDLWVFEALDGPRGPADPQALAVGRIDPEALAPGRVITVTAGGEAEAGPARRRGLRNHHGWRLALLEGHEGGLDRSHGVIGRAPAYCLAPPKG
ncbi:MAG TPA: chorismate mutase [Caulobacteraceae bacterium]|jgi:chorismate mutase